MNEQHVILLVLLDLSAAFDTVEHNILLEALNTLGLEGRVSKWLRSYLSGRSQRMLVRRCLSKKFDLNCGVLQGSCLGPLLFTIYTSSLLYVVKKCLPSVHCYADDPTLRLFPPRRWHRSLGCQYCYWVLYYGDQVLDAWEQTIVEQGKNWVSFNWHGAAACQSWYWTH